MTNLPLLRLHDTVMRVNGIDLRPYTWLQRKILMSLCMNYPKGVEIGQLIEGSYHPDVEPEWAEGCVRARVRSLRGQVPGCIIVAEYGRGYRLVKL